ncbi:ATP-binding response regulator [Luteithermobacter gelatinilyticus]|uniref:ATP-binding response regulator n=1 Tax=Luteithermobacter gelatinilyticus TaxID=2582913 RepID=UPI00110609E2|nr:NahK/ErcS family hybrid sensor histidine kinase/response regulator [Luteithermobacter gelatinilyticus]
MTERQSRLTDEEIKRLVLENARLNKTVQVLMERVEQEMDQQKDSFSLFQTAINLEKTIEHRTRELKVLNARLMAELAEREKVEEALRIAKQQAEEANQSKTKFLATASHDLRQPLNAARLFLGSLENDSLGDTETDIPRLETVKRIGAALDALDDLLSVLLNISQLDAGGIKPNFHHFPVQDLLNRIVPEYIKTGTDRGLEVRMVPSSAVVYSDGRLLETILRNFLSNAIRYTKKGKVLIGCRRHADGVTLMVYDSGIGIREDQLETIFEEFRQVHEDSSIGTRGIGLGLSIVDRIARLLGLSITVASVYGKGSCFGVTLPLGKPHQLRETSPEQSSSGKIPQTNLCDLLGERVIVVVDNDPQVLDGMRALLRNWTCKVVAETTAERCLIPLIEQDLIPGLIIADYHLGPTTNGLDALREIRAEFDPALPGLIITSDRNQELRDRLESLQIPLLYKPVKPARLAALIKHALS